MNTDFAAIKQKLQFSCYGKLANAHATRNATALTRAHLVERVIVHTSMPLPSPGVAAATSPVRETGALAAQHFAHRS